MKPLSMNEALAIISIQQLITEWAADLDNHNGQHVADIVTEDCEYVLGDMVKTGPSAVRQHYEDRLARLASTPEGIPPQRHLITNVLVRFPAPETASTTFSLLYFLNMGANREINQPDPVAVADVRMDFRLENGQHWKIFRFDSNQTFRRTGG